MQVTEAVNAVSLKSNHFFFTSGDVAISKVSARERIAAHNRDTGAMRGYITLIQLFSSTGIDAMSLLNISSSS